MAPLKKRTYRKPRRMVKKRGARRVSSITKLVKSVIQKTAETKCIQYYNDSIIFSNYTVGVLAGSSQTINVIEITPNSIWLPITQGNSQQGRIGNKIQTKSLIVKGYVYPRVYLATTPLNTDPRPSLVKIWIMYDKSASGGVVDPSAPQFFQAGNTSTIPNGTISDMFQPVNKDRYVVVASKVLKVGCSGYQSGTTGNVAPANSAYWHNNDYKMTCPFSFNLTKRCPKRFQFSDNSADPINHGLFMVYEAVNIQGSAMTANCYPVAMTLSLDYRYTDM